MNKFASVCTGLKYSQSTFVVFGSLKLSMIIFDNTGV